MAVKLTQNGLATYLHCLATNRNETVLIIVSMEFQLQSHGTSAEISIFNSKYPFYQIGSLTYPILSPNKVLNAWKHFPYYLVAETVKLFSKHNEVMQWRPGSTVLFVSFVFTSQQLKTFDLHQRFVHFVANSIYLKILIDLIYTLYFVSLTYLLK